jgi:hypothetical protein
MNNCGALLNTCQLLEQVNSLAHQKQFGMGN